MKFLNVSKQKKNNRLELRFNMHMIKIIN